jgi:hypothetical protein
MNLRLIASLILLIGNLTSSAPAAQSLSCNLGTLTHVERDRQHVLGGKLRSASIRREELPNGYALVIDRSSLPLNELAEWVSFESRCCPFLDFQISFTGDSGPLTLQLTGKSAEVKAFLAQEIRAFQGTVNQ